MTRANIMQAVLDDTAPWNLASESRAMAVWRAAQNLTSADASQERAIVDAVIEHLTELKEGRHG